MEQTLQSLKKFSIKDLERFTGIKAHTLRIWEHRYSLLTPQRTETNFRYYSTDELKRLMDVSLLNRKGFKISQLSSMNDEEIAKHINLLTDDNTLCELVINKLVIHMHTLDHPGFEMELNDCMERMSIDRLLKNIIFPFLEKTGLLWQGKQLNEEHLVVTAIRNKIILGIETVQVPDKKDKTVLLFLPEGKQLDLLLLYTSYLLKSNGNTVLFMGSDVTVANLKEVFAIKKPDFAFTYLPQKFHFPVELLSTFMQQHAPQSTLIVCIYPWEEMEIPDLPNVLFVNYEGTLQKLIPVSHK